MLELVPVRSTGGCNLEEWGLWLARQCEIEFCMDWERLTDLPQKRMIAVYMIGRKARHDASRVLKTEAERLVAQSVIRTKTQLKAIAQAIAQAIARAIERQYH